MLRAASSEFRGAAPCARARLESRGTLDGNNRDVTHVSVELDDALPLAVSVPGALLQAPALTVRFDPSTSDPPSLGPQLSLLSGCQRFGT